MKLYFVKVVFLGLSIIASFSCNQREIYRFNNGRKMMLSISNKKGIPMRSKTWYESGKLKSETRILKMDTIEKFDSLLNFTVFIPYPAEEIGKEWYESGKLKRQISMNEDGTKQIIYWSKGGIKMKKEVYSTNRLISTTIFSTDSVN